MKSKFWLVLVIAAIALACHDHGGDDWPEAGDPFFLTVVVDQTDCAACEGVPVPIVINDSMTTSLPLVADSVVTTESFQLPGGWIEMYVWLGTDQFLYLMEVDKDGRYYNTLTVYRCGCSGTDPAPCGTIQRVVPQNGGQSTGRDCPQ